MSADRDDFTGNLTLELPYVKPAEKPRQVGGLRASTVLRQGLPRPA